MSMSPAKTGSAAAGADPSPAVDRQVPDVGRPLSAWVTWLVATATIAATLGGLFAGGTYDASDYQVAIWRGQDVVTLLVVPVLAWAAARARAGSVRAHLTWVGLMAWIAYGSAHLAVGVPYNDLLLVYVVAFGLSAYATVDGLLRVDVTVVAGRFTRLPRWPVVALLVVGGVGVAGLWLTEIVAALPDGQPANLVNGMPHATYLLDLAIVVPLALVAASMTWRRHPAGVPLAGMMLVFLVVLSLAMLALVPFAAAAGLPSRPEFAGVFTIFSIVFTLVLTAAVGLLAVAVRRRAPNDGRPWLRPTLWHGMQAGR